MFKITQSNDTKLLLQHLVHHYQQNTPAQTTTDGNVFAQSLGVMAFAPFTVIVPAMVLGDWLTRSVADELGISTLFVAQFWGQYQWQMIQKVLQADAKTHPTDMLLVPEVAVLSGSVLRWRIFGFISTLPKPSLDEILADEDHPLHELLSVIYDESSQQIPEHRLWQSCDELAAVYVRYLTHRPEWLHAWTQDQPLPESVDEMIAKKDRFANDYSDGDPTPQWLVLHYQRLEQLLRFLWKQLFSQVYAHREALEARFWSVLEGSRGHDLAVQALALLPTTLYVFTVQQIPLVELQFLKRLSVHIDVHLLHFNPSKMFWADIVDKNWLATQRIINPQSVYLKDHGHALLSRLAKESRETFAMLADMSGGEFYYEQAPTKQADHQSSYHYATPKDWQVAWQDAFVAPKINAGKNQLLDQLKADILMLDEGAAERWWQQTLIDTLSGDAYWQDKIKPKSQMNLPLTHATPSLPSLSIHACASLRRQLQVARLIIARYLNEANDDGSTRKPSDVVVYLPDIGDAESLIRLVFDEGVGIDGLQLPAKITGTISRDIEMLMLAISGFYQLLGADGARFYREEVYEWLMTPVLYDSLGLDFAQMTRACELLDAAGFRRGFDTQHLAKTLNDADLDYRYSFSYALDRIVAGFLTPDTSSPSLLLHPFHWKQEVFAEAVLPLGGVTLADQSIVEALCVLHAALTECRDEYQRVAPVEYWLWHIEHRIIDRYFDKYRETSQMRAIFEAKNSIKASIHANKFYQRQAGQSGQVVGAEISLSLKFVLESITSMLSSQAVSAETTGMITFARFGTLRSIPFGLTVMLDMNLSTFPRQERQGRMDLMKAGLKRRGDRHIEDDDNGAFLDAILCTQDACAIFYTDTAEDGTTLLPASPVSELIEFFKSNVQWLTGSGEDEVGRVQSKIVQIAPELVESLLITKHAPTPFDVSLFYQFDQQIADEDLTASLKQKIDQAKRLHSYYLPPPPAMYAVRRILDTQEGEASAIIDLPEVLEYDTITLALQKNLSANTDPLQRLIQRYQIAAPAMMSLDQLYRLLVNPAKGYLQTKIALHQSQTAFDTEEPLKLDGLGRYQVKEMLIDALATGVFDGQSLVFAIKQSGICDQLDINQSSVLMSIYYDSLLPAGVGRLLSFDEQISQIEQLMMAFHTSMGEKDATWANVDAYQYSAMIAQTAEQSIYLDTPIMQTALIAKVPSHQAVRWLRVLPSAARLGHILRYYLHHLAWQVHRQTTEDDVKNGYGSSFWQFDKATDDLKYLGLDTDDCLLKLRPITATQAKNQLVNFLAFALMIQKRPFVLPAMVAMMMVKLVQDDISDWQTKHFAAWLQGDYEEHHTAAAWQILLKDRDVMAELSKAKNLAQILYDSLPESFE